MTSHSHAPTEQSATALDSIFRHAASSPSAVALLTPKGALTYNQLAHRVCAVADRLHETLASTVQDPKIPTQDPPCIAIHYPPSEELVIGILGVMAYGACCIPTAIDIPPERMDSLLLDAKPLALITPAEPSGSLKSGSLAINQISVEKLIPRAAHPGSTFAHRARSASPAIALYTSGTTGKPKAVLMTHQSFANLANVHGDAFSLGIGSRALIYGSPVHGNWINSLLSALANGATAVVAREEQLLPGPNLVHVLKTKRITHVHMPPTSLAALPYTKLPDLQILTLGGEALIVNTIAPWLDQVRLFNCYGATESNWLSFSEITGESFTQLTIGQPIAGMQAEVVDKQLQPVKQGEVGELIMSGVGLAQGYLNDLELTREKFIRIARLGNKLWYRSGDLARALGDGQHEVLGRNDSQLSIRGFRIEPGEVEATLIQHDAIAQAAVHGTETPFGSTQMVATLSLARGTKLSVEQLRGWLVTQLPRYMIPARFRVVAQLPLLANGKLDRSALANLSCQALPSNGGSRVPSTEHERTIANYWAKYTGEAEPYLESNFFVDGGDSLRAVQLLWELSKAFGANLSTSDFLVLPTLESLTQTINRAITQQTKQLAAKPDSAKNRTMPLSAPLTPTQERLWFISRYSPEPALYNVPYILELDGPVLPELIESGMRQIITRHLPLRSTISIVAGKPVQRVEPLLPSELATFQLKLLDYSAIEEAQAEVQARRVVEREANRPFDLHAQLTPRVMLIKITPNRQLLLLVIHHVICDGWSVANLFRELSHFYNAALPNPTASVTTDNQRLPSGDSFPSLTTNYFSYAQRCARDGDNPAGIEYWDGQMRNAPTRIQLPRDYAYPEQENHAGATQSISLDARLLEYVDQLAIKQAVTPSAILLGAYFILLNRLGAGEDLTVGVPLIGHQQADTKELIGLFASVVPIRARLASHSAVSELIDTVNQALRLAIAYPTVPIENATNANNGSKTRRPARLIQAVFSHQNVLSKEDVSFQGIDARVKPVFPRTAKFELLLNVEKLSNGWALVAEYRTALFSASTVARLLSNYKAVLQAIAKREVRTVADVCYETEPLSDSSKTPIRDYQPNHNSLGATKPARLHRLFERQFQKNPHAIALINGAHKLSYQKVNDEAQQIAEGLLALAIDRGAVVGLRLQRSKEAAIAMLGVLKAGCVYMPLPPEYPADRLDHMVESSAAALIICQSKPSGTGATAAREIDYQTLLGATETNTRPATELTCATPSNNGEVAYVMYTSGTLGTPNPVAVPHKGVIRLAESPDYVALSPTTVTLQLAPLAFDASTFEIWAAWLNGGCCVLFPDATMNLALLAKTIAREKVNTLWLTSSLFNAIVDENPNVLRGIEQLLVGGEALSVPHIAKAQAALPKVNLINGYGPTECTTFACTYPIPKNLDPRLLRVPIGKTIQRTSAWVLDHARRPIIPGFVGELYLGGDGVAIGYLNNKALTDQRFVTTEINGQETRLYKTGDLVVEKADGNLEFWGRADQQVKIAGFRIEPQQLERVLLDDPDVGNVAIGVQRREASTTLVAVIEPKTFSSSIEPIRTRANSKLAQHERPGHYFAIEKLPTTTNGKIDREALEKFVDSQGIVSSTEQSDPDTRLSDATEAWLLTLWKELLNRAHVRPTDNFFDLGGNSLLAIRCMERIRQTFQTELPLSVLFEAGNARELAEILRTAAENDLEWSSLVTIRLATNQLSTTNLFLVHALGGEVLGFAEFARYLGDDLSVYALQARGAMANQHPLDNLSEMAASYIQELQRVQPTGPYRLGGISMGGLVAHEMAVQLAAAGHIVDYLLVGDTWFFGGRPLSLASRPGYALKLLQKSPQLWRNWRSRSTNMKNVAEVESVTAEIQAERRKSIKKAHQAAIKSHEPGVFPGHMFLFSAGRIDKARLKDEVSLGSAAMGWDRLAKGGVTRTTLPGDHNSMFYGQGARRFAKELDASMASVKQRVDLFSVQTLSANEAANS